jgi:hypothetical protein
MAPNALIKFALAAMIAVSALGCGDEAAVEKSPADLEESRQQHIDRSNAERGLK